METRRHSTKTHLSCQQVDSSKGMALYYSLYSELQNLQLQNICIGIIKLFSQNFDRGRSSEYSL